MAQDLSLLISELSTYSPIGQIPQPKCLEFVRDYERFIRALKNIDQLIGLETVKSQISNQVKFFMVNYRRCGNPTNGEKLHTLLYGPPGCGKTQVGKYLAELWTVSGCLNPKAPGTPNASPNLPSLTNFNRAIEATKLVTTRITKINDPEKDQLRTDLAIREAQIRRYQEILDKTSVNVRKCLTGFNNARKKIKAQVPEKESQIQAKLQTIKKSLIETCSNLPNPNPVNINNILPVTVPNSPGYRSVFGSSDSPIFPNLPDLTAAQPTQINRTDLPPVLPPTLDSNQVGRTDLPPNLPPSMPPIMPPSMPTNLSQENLINKSTPPSQISQNQSTPPNQITSEPKKPVPPSKFVVVTRGDLIAKFQGHTTDKLRQLFEQYDGGVIFVDEAYNLVNSGNDDFGKEILTEINNYMSAYPERIIFIFAGYRKDMEQVVMKVQPGLARRFNWTFEIEGYTSEQLMEIFRSQLRKDNWDLKDDEISLFTKFFANHVKDFPHFGGDTEKLCAFVKEEFYSLHWKTALDDKFPEDEYQKIFDSIAISLVEKSFSKFLENSPAHLGEAQAEKEKQEFLKSTSIYS